MSSLVWVPASAGMTVGVTTRSGDHLHFKYHQRHPDYLQHPANLIYVELKTLYAFEPTTGHRSALPRRGPFGENNFATCQSAC